MPTDIGDILGIGHRRFFDDLAIPKPDSICCHQLGCQFTDPRGMNGTMDDRMDK
jgi:hypothetical protein